MFQQDNLKAHHALDDWIEQHDIQQVAYPTYSLDLSPIENLWSSLKHSIRQDGPKNEAELRSLENN